MVFSSQLMESAVNEFAKLPGIGRKTALRLVLHMLKQEKENVEHFGEVISKMRNEIRFCQRCNNVSDAELCSICANTARKPVAKMPSSSAATRTTSRQMKSSDAFS